jgi:hypothetical protein
MSLVRRGGIATIANAASLSNALDLTGGRLVAISLPAAWTAANLTLQASADGGVTFQDVYDKAGTEVTITVGGANRYIVLDSNTIDALDGIRFIKLRSGTTAVPVAQGAQRDLIVFVK